MYPLPAISIAGDAFDRAHRIRQLRRDRLGSFLQLPRELERSRQRDFAERGLFRLLRLNRALLAVQGLNLRGESLRDPFFQEMKHEQPVWQGGCPCCMPLEWKQCPRLRSPISNKTVEFESGKLPYDEHGKPESILDVALNFGIQLEHACGGVCACTTCHVHVKAGQENLSAPEDDELDRLDMAADLQLNSRLGCQAIVKGDITVDMPGWNRNYVSEGGGSMNLGDAIPPPKNTVTSASE